jgi:hypothetical protein
MSQKGTLTVSRGPGRIERAIAAIFAAEPDNALTVPELALGVYPKAKHGPYGKQHEVAILRAVKSLARNGATIDIWRRKARGCKSNPVFIYNFASVISYATARLKEGIGKRLSDAEINEMLSEGGEYHRLVIKGGAWLTDAQFRMRRYQLTKAGDTAGLARLEAEIEADMAQRRDNFSHREPATVTIDSMIADAAADFLN